jgi:hypothetical protein
MMPLLLKVKHALLLFMPLWLSRIIVETDSALALRSDSFDQSPGGVIYREARDLVDLHFVSIDVSTVSRDCNQCAHELAHSGLARDPNVPGLWNVPLPSFVIDLVGRDVMVPPVE